MDHIQGIDRNQISIFALEEMVAKDSWARLIDVFVDALPLDNLGFKAVETAEEGRPPYHPVDLLKLYMYGYKHGLRSTRKLEHAAQVNIELWWLLKGLKPSNRAIADKGYNTGEQLQACRDNDITTYVSPKQSNTQHLNCIQTNQFKYNARSDTYTCPANEILVTNGSYYKKGNYRMKQYKTRACSCCTIKNQCTRNKTGRLIERNEYQEVIEENRDRVLADPDYYRTRQQIIEHQFGTMERQWGFTHTLMKGKKAVLSEVYLLFMIYNLRRSASILGLEGLKKRIKALFALIFHRIWATGPCLNHSLTSFRLAI